MALTVYSALALSAPFNVLEQKWQETHGNIPLGINWYPSKIIENELNAGRKADVVIATVETIDRLIYSGLAESESRIEVVDSPVGVAVRAGAMQPDISSRATLIDSLLAARSVAWSEAGASGVYFSQLLQQLGIENELRARGTVIPAGFTAEQLINGKADLAIQQISELLMVEGIDVIGPLPPEVQQPVSISAAVLRHAEQPVAATEFLKWLKSPQAMKIFSQFGLVRRD